MNPIIPTYTANLPIYPQHPAPRPVGSVSDNASQFRDPRQSPSTYVYRGEVIEGLADDRRYRPQYNQTVSPQNRRAIETYQQVSQDPQPTGQILNGFI